MKWTAFFLSMLVTGVATAQDDNSNSDDAIAYPDIGWYDLHGNNRAVAFGSILLAAEGYSVDNWQALEAWDLCYPWPMPIPGDDDDVEPIPGPDPVTGNSDGGDVEDPTDPFPGECEVEWDVMVTTAYDLTVCPDGRAYIVRSGIGTFLEDRHTGHSYEWSEEVGCEDDLKNIRHHQGMDKDRPIDRQRVTRRFN